MIIKIIKQIFCFHKWKYIEKSMRYQGEYRYKGRRCIKCKCYEKEPVTGTEKTLFGWK